MWWLSQYQGQRGTQQPQPEENSALPVDCAIPMTAGPCNVQARDRCALCETAVCATHGRPSAAGLVCTLCFADQDNALKCEHCDRRVEFQCERCTGPRCSDHLVTDVVYDERRRESYAVVGRLCLDCRAADENSLAERSRQIHEETLEHIARVLAERLPTALHTHSVDLPAPPRPRRSLLRRLSSPIVVVEDVCPEGHADCRLVDGSRATYGRPAFIIWKYRTSYSNVESTDTTTHNVYMFRDGTIATDGPGRADPASWYDSAALKFASSGAAVSYRDLQLSSFGDWVRAEDFASWIRKHLASSSRAR